MHLLRALAVPCDDNTGRRAEAEDLCDLLPAVDRAKREGGSKLTGHGSRDVGWVVDALNCNAA